MNPEDLIGMVVNGIRRTKDGFVKEDSNWWFFQRDFPDKKRPYWYAKKRSESGEDVLEEYVGVDLPFTIPRELLTSEEYSRYAVGELIIEPEEPENGNNQ